MPVKPNRPGRLTVQMPDEIPPLWRTDVTRGGMTKVHKALAALGPGAFRTAALRKWSDSIAGSGGGVARQIVTCRIEWDRSLGLPAGVAPEAAFTAVHWRWQQVKEFLPGSRVRWIDLASPVLPGPALTATSGDDARHRVGILLVPTTNASQGLEVGFAEGVRWVRPDGRPLRVALRPALRRFSAQEGPQSLPAFVVTEAG